MCQGKIWTSADISHLAVKTGRVTKPKKTPAAKVKAEMLDDESYFGNTSNNGASDTNGEEDEILV